ncbi:MAG: beta-galactosidase [Bacteroidales bacterium]|nr:beta-galactosidase [Bacteroidales bacterium]
MKKIITLAILSLAAVSLAAAARWQPVGDHIRTPWADEVSARNPLPEYPRPQMVRGSWKSLNGLWNYAITAKDIDEMPEAAGEILVPFALESSLSGVAGRLTDDDALWYSRSFRVPCLWHRKTVLLHFDAVDYACEVWLNGQKIGEHKGGYTAFEFDITKYLKRGRQHLVLKVLDGTDNGLQPRGKQVMDPTVGKIWYTAVSGIWQSVWMEAVSPKGHILDYDAVSPDLKSVCVTPYAEGAEDVLVELLDGKRTVAGAEVKSGESIILSPADPKLWSPDEPNLYGLRLTLLKDGKKIDRVQGYTAIRTISKVADEDGHLRMALNGKVLFQFGPLDQGWWPDGLYTAPTDEALAFDIVKTKEYGFNMIRKHIKVEPARWYWHCDRLGILVWQDMPCTADYEKREDWAQGADVYDAGNSDQLCAEARENFVEEWKEILRSHRKYPCIVVWVPFNEAWGQFDTKEVVALTQQMDPSRLVNMASGGNWISGGVGDILDSHHYSRPKMRLWDPALVNVLGEYGGIGLPLEGHTWVSDKNWGYVKFSTSEEATAKYVEYAEMLHDIVRAGCAAAVYTQTTDVERELNGLLTYDREIEKLDKALVAAANSAVIHCMD